MSSLRTLMRAVILVALLLFPAVALTGPATAAGGGSLSLSTSSGSAGTRVLLTGTGFTPGEQVQPFWDYGTAGSIAQKSFYLYNPVATADGTGVARTDMFIPVVPGATHTISLVGATSGAVDTASFTVTQRLDTGSQVAPAGSLLRFAGWGLGAKEAVYIYWNGTKILSASTDGKGSFSGRSWTIPAGTAPGTYTASATGATSGLTATATVTVGPVPTGPAPGSDDWAQWGFDPQNHRVNPVDAAFSPSNIAQAGLAWQARISGPDIYQASPAVANGIVYIGSVHGLLSAYNESSGSLLWQFQAPGPIYGSPTIANGIVYFGTVNEPQETVAGNYAFARVAATGDPVWSNALPNGGEWVPPLVANGVVYFTMANREGASGGLIAFDALTGVKKWETDTPYGIWATPALDPSGQYLYQGTGNPCFTESNPQPGDGCSGYVIKVSVADGTYTTLIHAPDVSGDDDIATSVVYDGGNLYFGCKDGIFYSISATTGAINWQDNTGFAGDGGIYSSASVYNGRVYFGSMGARQVWALNESDGSIAWKYGDGGQVAASPIVSDGMVFVASYGKTFAALDPATGNVLWSTTLASGGGASAVVSNGIIFQSVSNGGLNAYTLGTQAPSFVSAGSATATVGSRFGAVVTAAGLPGPAITETGVLPAGVSFTPSTYGGTATFAGTPAAGSQGTYPVTLTAKNGSGTATQSFTLTVQGSAPAFTSASSASAVAGQPFTFSVTATGTPTPTLFATSGTVPAGLTFVDNGAGNGTISGTPASAGTYTIVLNAHNGAGPDAVQDFVLTVAPAPAAPAFTADSPPSPAAVNQPYSYTFAAAGSPAPTFAVASGALPTGLSLDPNSGVLSGTPSQTGSYTFTVSASNGVGSAAVTPPITISVTSGAVITSPATATATVGQPFTFTVTSAGSPTPTISESGALPSGVSFTANTDGTGTLAGTPASGQEGNWPITFTADNGSSSGTQNFTLVVNGGAPAFTADTPPGAVAQNVSFSYTFSASADPPATFSVASGSLPPGLSLDSTSGVLSGTPTTVGSYTFTVEASNGVGSPAVTPSITMSVVGPADVQAGLVGPTSVPSGSTMTYTVTVYNLGPSTAVQIAASFTLPAGTTFVSTQNPSTYANGVVSWQIASIASGRHVNLKLYITADTKGTDVASANAQAVNSDPNPGNNSATFSTTVK